MGDFLRILLDSIYDPYTYENINELETTLAQSIEYYVDFDDFFKLPPDCIFRIVKMGIFKDYNRIKTLVIKMTRNYPKEAPLLLNSINFNTLDINKVLEIFACFTKSPLCNELNTTEFAGKPENFEPSFSQAIQKGDLESVKYHIINLKANVEEKHCGDTAIMQAVNYGHSEIIHFLYKFARADITTKDGVGNTLLSQATTKNHLSAVKTLIEVCRVDINEVSANDHQTALYTAASEGFLDIVEYLIDRGANVEIPNKNDATPFYIACENGHLDCAKMLYEKGHSDPNKKLNDSCFPLYIALQNRHIDIGRYLIRKCGADPNKLYKDKFTCLYNVVTNNDMDSVKFLVEEIHVDVDKPDNLNITPTYLAIDKKFENIARYLIDVGHSNVNALTTEKASLVYMAVERGLFNLVRYLIEEKHADYTTRFKGIYGPLGHAGYGNNMTIVKYFVETLHQKVSNKEFNEIESLSIKSYLREHRAVI